MLTSVFFKVLSGSGPSHWQVEAQELPIFLSVVQAERAHLTWRISTWSTHRPASPHRDMSSVCEKCLVVFLFLNDFVSPTRKSLRPANWPFVCGKLRSVQSNTLESVSSGYARTTAVWSVLNLHHWCWFKQWYIHYELFTTVTVLSQESSPF